MSFARYEVLLPEQYNDGTPIEQSKFEQTWFELFERFGALTLEPVPRRGMWSHVLEQAAPAQRGVHGVGHHAAVALAELRMVAEELLERRVRRHARRQDHAERVDDGFELGARERHR